MDPEREGKTGGRILWKSMVEGWERRKTVLDSEGDRKRGKGSAPITEGRAGKPPLYVAMEENPHLHVQSRLNCESERIMCTLGWPPPEL